jgi:hypothetical protein
MEESPRNEVDVEKWTTVVGPRRRLPNCLLEGGIPRAARARAAARLVGAFKRFVKSDEVADENVHDPDRDRIEGIASAHRPR